MAHITFDYSKVLDKFVAPHEVDIPSSTSNSSRRNDLRKRNWSQGQTFLGWCEPSRRTTIVKNLIVS